MWGWNMPSPPKKHLNKENLSQTLMEKIKTVTQQHPKPNLFHAKIPDVQDSFPFWPLDPDFQGTKDLQNPSLVPVAMLLPRSSSSHSNHTEAQPANPYRQFETTETTCHLLERLIFRGSMDIQNVLCTVHVCVCVTLCVSIKNGCNAHGTSGCCYFWWAELRLVFHTLPTLH